MPCIRLSLPVDRFMCSIRKSLLLSWASWIPTPSNVLSRLVSTSRPFGRRVLFLWKRSWIKSHDGQLWKKFRFKVQHIHKVLKRGGVRWLGELLLVQERKSEVSKGFWFCERWLNLRSSNTVLLLLVLDASIHQIVPALMKRFSSREGYAAFEDAIPTSGWLFMLKENVHTEVLVERLHNEMGVATAVVSNGDSRIRKLGSTFFQWAPRKWLTTWFPGSVIQDLGFPSYLCPIVLSEEEGIEKPCREIFERTLALFAKKGTVLKPDECLHVGDELVW